MVISGQYKGSVGIVLKVLTKENRIIVEGVNKVMKRIKANENGENYVEKESPIHISNVALVDPKTEKPVKVGFVFDKDKIKIRVNRKTKDHISKSF